MKIEDEKTRIEDFVARGNYHAAINLSISAINECRRNKNQQGVECFLELIQRIIDQMRAEYSKI